jgi:hypothetical protein
VPAMRELGGATFDSQGLCRARSLSALLGVALPLRPLRRQIPRLPSSVRTRPRVQIDVWQCSITPRSTFRKPPNSYRPSWPCRSLPTSSRQHGFRGGFQFPTRILWHRRASLTGMPAAWAGFAPVTDRFRVTKMHRKTLGAPSLFRPEDVPAAARRCACRSQSPRHFPRPDRRAAGCATPSRRLVILTQPAFS